MIEHGANIKSQLQQGASKSDLAMPQLLQHNCFTKYNDGSRVHRYSKDRNTPFVVYVSMSVFVKTRRDNSLLNDNGLSILYDRVLEISAQLGEAVVAQCVEDGVVCLPVLRKQLFTTSAVDKINHNPTATTAKTSFYVTSVSLVQHPCPQHFCEERHLLKNQSRCGG